MERSTVRLTFVVAIVVTSLATMPLLGTVAADTDDPETADDYFETFSAMEGTEAYEEYDEFETIRTFAVTQTQEIGTLEADERAELAAVLETMEAFERAYTYAENGEYERSLEAAEAAEESIAELEQYEQTQATLADLALTRFYEGLADGLHGQAEAADRTPDRLELLEMTATAYERANMPDEAAEFNLQVEQGTAEYEAALERMDEAEADAEAFLESCVDCTDLESTVVGSVNAFETFENYRHVQELDAELEEAEAAAATHGLEDREEELAAISADVDDAWLSLAAGSVSVLVGFGVLVGLSGTIVAARIFAWQQTYDRSQVGSVVTAGEADV